MINKFNYDTNKYYFKSIIEEWFSLHSMLPLAGINKLHRIKQYEHFDREHDQSTDCHKIFYDMIRKDNLFNNVYIKLVNQI